MPLDKPLVASIAVPAASMLNGVYRSPDLADAYAIRIPADATPDPETLARFVFTNPPAWVTKLMAVRDAAVAGFGLKTSRQLRSPQASAHGRIGIFRIYEASADEIVLGEDDRHLDFRVSVRYEPKTAAAGSSPRVVVSTVVHCHNLLGRSYLGLIEPFHRAVVKSFLRRAARIGWPTQASG